MGKNGEPGAERPPSGAVSQPSQAWVGGRGSDRIGGAIDPRLRAAAAPVAAAAAAAAHCRCLPAATCPQTSSRRRPLPTASRPRACRSCDGTARCGAGALCEGRLCAWQLESATADPRCCLPFSPPSLYPALSLALRRCARSSAVTRTVSSATLARRGTSGRWRSLARTRSASWRGGWARCSNLYRQPACACCRLRALLLLHCRLSTAVPSRERCLCPEPA